MMGKLKTKNVQLMKFYNDDYDLILIFQPKVTEPPIDPPVEPIAIPTGIKLTEYNIVEPPTEINIPTGIELTEYKI